MEPVSFAAGRDKDNFMLTQPLNVKRIYEN